VDQIKEQMDQLAELGDDQVVELQSSILKQFELVEKEDPTPQTVDAMTSLADMLDGVRNEVKRREAAAIELAQRATEAASRVYGQDGEKEEENMEAKTEEAPMAEEAPVAPVTEEAPAEEAPVSDTPAPMEEEKKMEEAAEMPVAPEKETPSDMEEDEKKKEEETMTEASTEAGKNTEFSTESQIETPAPVAVVEEPVVAAAEESVAPAATEEAPTAEVASAEAPVAEAVAETVVDAPVSAEASVETVEGAEASIQETSTQASEPTLVQENMEAPVTAAANADNLNIEVPADRRPTSRTSAAPVAITAGADIPGYTAGSPLDNMNVVAEAMAKRLHGLRRVNGGDGEQHIVASVTTSFPEDRTLTQDAESNWAKINAVTSPEALVASGGHAAPFETKYDIFGLGTTARPVRDALPRFQADRGGIRFVTPPVLSSYGNAVGVWTNAVDTNPGTDVKASLTVSAAAEQTVATDAVTLQLQFGNLMTRAYPELIARHNELGLIQHAREAEQNLLSKIASASSAVTTTSLIGFGRDFLVQLGRAAAAYRSRHRLEADAPLRAIIPAWVKDAMAADLALAMPGDGTLNAYAEIDGYVASRGVALTASLDQNVSGSQSASAALNEFADSFTWYLFAEGSFLFLDGGTLDLGIIRDSTLVGTNDYKMFVETFEGIAFIGVEALVITSTISINGVAAALRDTTGGASAAAIEY
jgi:chemotaxis protein histidine kinase CheA